MIDARRPAAMSIEGRLESNDETAIKCYKCYSKRVSAICHHCGRLLCKECQSNLFGPLHTDNAFARIRPLPNLFKQSAHCEDCFHYEDTIARLVLPSILVIAAILILLPPIIQLTQQQAARWMALVPFAPWGAGALILLLLARLTWCLHPLLPFPVKYPLGIPVFPTYTIELHEHVKADFDITPDRYLPQHIPCGGQLTAKLGLVPEDEERYRSAPKPKTSDGKETIHAGFVVLDQQKNVRFLKKMRQHLGNGLTLSITEEIASDDFTRLCHERQPIEWTGHYLIDQEGLRLGPKYDKEFPLFIKPRLLPGGRRLELMLELHKEIARKEIARKATVVHLTLGIPPGCGVEDTDGQFDPSRWQVAWREKKVTTAHPFVLYIEFQKPLGTQPRSFKGEYKLIIEDYTLSGLRVGEDSYAKGKSTETGKYVIRPASGSRLRAEKMKWMEPTVKHKTTIEGEVSFDTSAFWAYSIHMIPEVPERSEEYRVPPSHKVIDAIIAALTHPRRHPPVYIQRVIETLGRIAETETGSRQARCWEIKGRYYIGSPEEENGAGLASDDHSEWNWPPSMPIGEQMAVSNQIVAPNPPNLEGFDPPQDALTGLLQPVDVHLVILGEEPRDDHPDSSHGTLHFELVLRSVVSDGDPGTTDLREHYEILRKIIEKAICSSGRR